MDSKVNTKKIKRVIVLKRGYYKQGQRSGGNWTEEYETFHNLSQKKLEEILAEKNKGLRTNLWTVIGDYNFAKKRDQAAYFKYCLSCFYDPYTRDYKSATVGLRMVHTLSDDYYGL